MISLGLDEELDVESQLGDADVGGDVLEDSLKDVSGVKGDASAAKNEAGVLNEKVGKLLKELDAQRDLYVRLAAEYDNYRKRTEKYKLLISRDTTASVVACFLSVADSLSAALKSFGNAPEEYRKGLDLLSGQLKAAFDKLGVVSFGKEGEVFDPQECEAIQHIVDDTLGENVIAEVLRKGYRIGDKVIRCAMVRVAN